MSVISMLVCYSMYRDLIDLCNPGSDDQSRSHMRLYTSTTCAKWRSLGHSPPS